MKSYQQNIEEMRRKAAAEKTQREREDSAYERKAAHAYQHRDAFLQKASAIPTPVECYALWLAVYLEQGGSAEHVDRNFTTLPTIVNGTVGSSDDPIRFTTPANWQSGNYKGYQDLMPTAWTNSPLSIPVGYGAMSMDLLIFEDLVNVDLRATSGDRRPGCEYGHTTVFVLKKGDGPFGLRASTNEPYGIRSHPDVEAILLSNSIESLANAYHRRLEMPRTNYAEEETKSSLETVRPGELTASPQMRDKKRKWFGR